MRSSFTNRIIAANDNASIQFNVGHVDAQGHIIPGIASCLFFPLVALFFPVRLL